MSQGVPLLRVCDFRHPPLDDQGDRFRFPREKTYKAVFESGSIRGKRFALRASAANQAERPEPKIGPIRVSSCCVLILLILPFMSIASMIALDIASGYLLLGFITLYFGTAVAYSHYRYRGTQFLIATSALAEGICACCSFSLEGLEPNEAGDLLCPECGHAWNAGRVVRPHWEPIPHASPRNSGLALDMRHSLILGWVTRYAPDDCGRLMRVHNSRLWQLHPIVREQRAQHEWEQLTSKMRSNGRILRSIVSISFMTLFVIGVARWMLPAFYSDISEFYASCIVLFFSLAISIIVLFGDFWIGRVRRTHVLNATGCCGSCANDLTSILPNRNMMRVCDLCRSSWLDDRFPERDTCKALPTHDPSLATIAHDFRDQ